MFIKTVSTTSGINPIKFDETGGVFYWILNTGLSTIYASTKSTFTAGDDGVVSLGPKESRRLETNNDTIYILGAGQVEIHNQRDGICSFKQAPTSSGSGGGGTIDAYSKTESDAKYAAKSDVPDAYTKTESDAKYAQKTDIPTTLPANGGNADTLGGKSPSDFVEALTIQQTNYTRILIPDNVDVKSWLLENAKIGTVYYVTPECQGQINLPPMTVYGWAWFLFDGIRYVAKVMVSDVSAKYYLLDGINISGDWKEISTTPIKSTVFSGTTDNNSICHLWEPSENKIPIAVMLIDMLATIFYSSKNMYAFTVQQPDTHLYKPNIQVSGTIYYIEV